MGVSQPWQSLLVPWSLGGCVGASTLAGQGAPPRPHTPTPCRKRLEEAPLVTKAFREAQMREKLERYPKVHWGANGGGCPTTLLSVVTCVALEACAAVVHNQRALFVMKTNARGDTWRSPHAAHGTVR